MDDTVAARMNLTSDWELTAEGRAAAISRALEILALDPNDRDATDLLSSVAMYILPFTRQREIGQQLLAAEPSSVAGASLVCRAAYQLGGLDESVTILRDNLAAHPEHAAGWIRLASYHMLLNRAGDLAAAQDAIDRACALEPDGLDCGIARARMMIERKHRAEGVALLRQLRPRSPIAVDLDLARELFLSRQQKETDGLLDGVLSLVPDSSLALMLRAMVRANQNRGQEALEAARAALDSAGPGNDTYMTYGRVCLKFGAPERAVTSFEYQTQLRPDNTYAWACLSVARGRMRDRDGSRRARAEALATMPAEGPKARIQLGAAELQLRLHTAPPSSWILRAAGATTVLLALGVLASILAGLTWLAQGRWIIGALGVSPLIICCWAVLRAARRAPEYARRTRTGAALVIGSIGMTLVHAVLAGIGVVSDHSLDSAILSLYFWPGMAGVVLMLLASQKPLVNAEGIPIPARSMRDRIRTAQPDPPLRAALGAISFLIAIPGVLCGGLSFAATVVSVGLVASTPGMAPLADEIGPSLHPSLWMLAAGVAYVALFVGGTAALIDRNGVMSYGKKLLMVWCYGIAVAVFLGFAIESLFTSTG